jgi:hypothetical protein
VLKKIASISNTSHVSFILSLLQEFFDSLQVIPFLLKKNFGVFSMSERLYLLL